MVYGGKLWCSVTRELHSRCVTAVTACFTSLCACEGFYLWLRSHFKWNKHVLVFHICKKRLVAS